MARKITFSPDEPIKDLEELEVMLVHVHQGTPLGAKAGTRIMRTFDKLLKANALSAPVAESGEE